VNSTSAASPRPASRARGAGLVHHVTSDVAVEDEAMALARRMARHSGAALRMTKRTIAECAALPRGAALLAAGAMYVNDVMRTADALEGLKAFTEKRTPSWSHQ